MSKIEQNILTPSEVSVKTAAIEVKVLKIGNRQLTLSVFRQLVQKPLIDPDSGELRGTPWGRVNYHVDCETVKSDARHLHIVWQEGNELRRSIAVIPWSSAECGIQLKELLATCPCSYFERIEERDLRARLYLKARILEGWSVGNTQLHKSIQMDLAGYTFAISLDQCMYVALGPYTEMANRAKKAISNELQQLIGTTKSERIWQCFLLPSLLTLEKFTTTWEQSYTQLRQLDQLFIAI